MASDAASAEMVVGPAIESRPRSISTIAVFARPRARRASGRRGDRRVEHRIGVYGEKFGQPLGCNQINVRSGIRDPDAD
jgi:hypothetical protein